MADFTYTRALKYGPEDIAAMDLRALIVMTGSDAPTLEDAQFIASFTALEEYDGANYGRIALTGEAAAVDLVNDRYNVDSNAIAFGNLGVASAAGIGIVILKFVTNDADSEPIFYKDSGGFPFVGNGGAVTWTPHADGIAYVRNA